MRIPLTCDATMLELIGIVIRMILPVTRPLYLATLQRDAARAAHYSLRRRSILPSAPPERVSSKPVRSYMASALRITGNESPTSSA